MALPEGFDTVAGARGYREAAPRHRRVLQNGQKVLILDEG